MLEEIVSAIPQLERLCVRLPRCWDYPDCECRSFFKYNPYQITGLRNLTHLGLLTSILSGEDIISLWKHLINGLPRLSYVYRFHDLDTPMLYHVVRHPDDTDSYELVPLTGSKDMDAWEFLQ